MSLAEKEGFKPLRILILLALCLVATTSRAEDTLACLSEHSGQVQILKAQGEWAALKDGDEIHPGDRIRTLAQSTATLQKTDGTTLELLPLAEVTMLNERGFRVHLGRIWSRFVHAVGGKFFIETPTTTALIRGTVLLVSHEGEESRVLVSEGLVSVHDREQASIDVAEGYAVRVGRGRLGRLERAGENELRDGRRFLDRVQRMPKLELRQRPWQNPQPGMPRDRRDQNPMPGREMRDPRMEERNDNRNFRTQALEQRQVRQERQEPREMRQPWLERRELRDRRQDILRDRREQVLPFNDKRPRP